MNLLTRLRQSFGEETFPSPEISDDDHYGIGGLVSQDIVNMDFLESHRRRIPDLHEEFPPHGFCISHSELEADS